jgi:hypothetical protein
MIGKWGIMYWQDLEGMSCGLLESSIVAWIRSCQLRYWPESELGMDQIQATVLGSFTCVKPSIMKLLLTWHYCYLNGCCEKFLMIHKHLSLVRCDIHINNVACHLQIKEYEWILVLVELMVHFVYWFRDLWIQEVAAGVISFCVFNSVNTEYSFDIGRSVHYHTIQTN